MVVFSRTDIALCGIREIPRVGFRDPTSWVQHGAGPHRHLAWHRGRRPWELVVGARVDFCWHEIGICAQVRSVTILEGLGLQNAYCHRLVHIIAIVIVVFITL